MASCETFEWRPRDREELLGAVVRRGRQLRARRQAALVAVGLAVAALLPVGTITVLNATDGDARVRTVPAEAPATEQGDAGGGTEGINGSGSGAGPGARGQSGSAVSAPGAGMAAGGSGRLDLRSHDGNGHRGWPEDREFTSDHDDGDGHSHVHDKGCNVVGGPGGGGVGGEDEDYLALTECDYWPSSNGGYVASGLEWRAVVDRDGEIFTVSPSTAGRPCEPVGFFRPGDRVRLMARPGSSIAAGARYGCG